MINKKALFFFIISLFVFMLLMVSPIITIAEDKNVDNSSLNAVGRFQLFQGEYQFVNLKGEEYWLKGLFGGGE